MKGVSSSSSLSSDNPFQSVRLSAVHCSCGQFSSNNQGVLVKHALQGYCASQPQHFSSLVAAAKQDDVICPYLTLGSGERCNVKINQNYKRHLKTHMWSKRYTCHTCQQSFTEWFLLCRHQRSCRPTSEFNLQYA